MASNLSFGDTPAASVSLACCQSLCDLLKELPLPSSHQIASCLSSRRVVDQNSHQNNSSLSIQLEAALSHAKQELSELVFNTELTTAATTPTASMSPLTMQLSLKGVFGFGALVTQNHNNCYESNSLETIEPSLRTSLEFDSTLKLLDDCLQNDCNDTDVKYFPQQTTDTTEEADYSSTLGERVKSRQRMNNNSETTHRRPHDDSESRLERPPVVTTTQPVVNTTDDRRQREREERKEKEKKREKEEKKKSYHSSNHNEVQHKDSCAAFEQIVSRLMSDCVDDTEDDSDDDRNDMSFDLRIDARELNHLMSLSSKLKHSNKAKDLESKLGPKLTSFLSLLTNKMTVWFSKFKESDDTTTTGDDSVDDNQYWLQLISASKMSLNLMTARGMSSRVVLFEELLEIIVNFLSHNLNSRTHVQSAQKSPSKSKKAQSGSHVTCAATKRQVAQWTELLELLREYLARNKSLNDSLVLMMTRAAQSALFLSSPELQLVAIQVLREVFANYPKHRHSMLEDLLQHFHRIPAQRQTKSGQSGQVCVLTRLLTTLTTCLFPDTCERVLTRDTVSARLTECLQVTSAFLSQFQKKCLAQTQTACDVDLKQVFDHVLQDLLQSVHAPHAMSASLLVQIVTKLLITNLNNKSSSLQLKLNSIEFLANISSRFGKLLSEKQDIEEEATKTLNQLVQSDSGRQHSQRVQEVVRLVNQFFDSQRLFSEKQILIALWSKESKINQIQDKFFAIMSTKNSSSNTDDEEPIDGSTCQLFIRNLELNAFQTIVKLFDASLSHVTSSLSLTTNTTQRSRAMKSLSQILVNCTLEKSTQLLGRQDLQVAMKSALLDASTSVREATVDLIGRFVLQSKSLELCDKYADLISERVLDTGVSVRKRVIKILRDVCVLFPHFQKCGEIQLKIIKRAQDEGEGIRKLVLETVRDLWFKNVTQEDVQFRAQSLLHVIKVMLQQEGQIDALHVLLEQIVKNDSEVQCAALLTDHVVSHVLIDAAQSGQRQRALHNLAAMTLVALFSGICPELLVKHVDVLQSLLSLTCDSLVDIHLQKKLVQSLERILVKVSNPSQQLLNRLEEDLCKQILQSSALILPNCVKCLSVLIEQHTKNTRLATDLFAKFRQILFTLTADQNKPKLLRAVYSLGLFLKYFPKHISRQDKDQVLDSVLQLIHSYTLFNGQIQSQTQDLVVCCLTSLGFVVESDPKVCLRPQVIDLYERLLNDTHDSAAEPLRRQVLTNFCNYLSESAQTDEQMNKQIEWSRESLKQMTSESDDSNSLQSQIIQQYLALLLQQSLSPSNSIRRVACNVVHVIQTGGHVHPLQLVPHLIAMTTDDDSTIRSRADHVLHEIERKFHGFVAMKAKAGIELSLRLCSRLQCRGFRLLDSSDSNGDVTSRLATLYHVICTNRQSRRGFVQQLLRTFEVSAEDDIQEEEVDSGGGEETGSSQQLMFEMVLFFPFNVQDEVMFILQQLECIQSVNSTQLSQLFKEVFGFQTEQEMDDLFDDNSDNFAKEVNERGEVVLCRRQLIRRCFFWLKKLFLVWFLRRLLKEFYLVKDEKILEYSPNESKQWEKPIHRRHIETRNLADCLLRANPSNCLLKSDVTIEQLLEEWQRFKSVSLQSRDTKVTSQWIQQKLFTQQKSPAKSSTTSVNMAEPEVTATGQVRRTGSDDINEEQRKRLLESIRKTQCSVSLVDIKLDPNLVTGSKRKPEVMEVETEVRSEKNRQKSKKKKKRKRVRIEDSDEEEESVESEESSSDEFRC